MKKIVVIIAIILLFSGCNTGKRLVECTKEDDFSGGTSKEIISGIFKNDLLDTYEINAEYIFIEEEKAKDMYDQLLYLKSENSDDSHIDITLKDNIITIYIKYTIDEIDNIINDNNLLFYTKEKTYQSFIDNMESDNYTCTNN